MIVIASSWTHGKQSRRQFLQRIFGATLAATIADCPQAGAADNKPSEIFQVKGDARKRFLERSWREGQTLAAVRTGPTDAPKLVQFIDPLCPLFQRQWWALRAYREQLRIHWIPVAFVHPQSLPTAANILANAYPADALEEAAQRAGTRPPSGASIVPSSKAAVRQVQSNTQFWLERFGVLPLLLYPHPRGPHAAMGPTSPGALAEISRAAWASQGKPISPSPMPDYHPGS